MFGSSVFRDMYEFYTSIPKEKIKSEPVFSLCINEKYLEGTWIINDPQDPASLPYPKLIIHEGKSKIAFQCEEIKDLLIAIGLLYKAKLQQKSLIFMPDHKSFAFTLIPFYPRQNEQANSSERVI